MRIYWEVVVDNQPEGEDSPLLFFIDIPDTTRADLSPDARVAYLDARVQDAFRARISYRWWEG